MNRFAAFIALCAAQAWRQTAPNRPWEHVPSEQANRANQARWSYYQQLDYMNREVR